MIKVKNLCKRYGMVEAVRNVSFNVQKGEVVGFLGPNGAGKTTTMKMLTGFFPPTAGQVEIGGMTIDKHLIDIKRKIGYLPENVPLYQDMCVDSFLSFVSRMKGIPRREQKRHISLAIEECALQSVSKRLIGNLSKGYKQRVGLAQALVGNPSVLVLDEPTIGLDPKQIIEIRSLIKRMAGEKTVILSTHILPEASMIADRVIIINEGSIVAIDSPQNLHNRLQVSHEIALVVDGDEEHVLSIIKKVPYVIDVRVNKKTQEGVEYRVSSEKNEDIRPYLAEGIVKSKKRCYLFEIKSISMSLEDIFLKLVTKEDEVS